MSVEHQPSAHLRSLIARTACGAWSWRKASLRLAGRRRTGRKPWRLGPVTIGRPPRQWEARASVLAACWAARALEAAAVVLPGRVALACLVRLHRLASWGGASAFEAGLRQARVEEVEPLGWWPGRAHDDTPPNGPAM
jgi:hypothetical protein